jgi:hypothetical protein
MSNLFAKYAGLALFMFSQAYLHSPKIQHTDTKDNFESLADIWIKKSPTVFGEMNSGKEEKFSSPSSIHPFPVNSSPGKLQLSEDWLARQRNGSFTSKMLEHTFRYPASN